jgi:hypothetical protein
MMGKIFNKRTFPLIFVTGVFLISIIDLTTAAEIKKPNVSGMFYPSGRQALSAQIDGFLDKAEVLPVADDIIVLVSPHAGYIYSGPVAAYGYKVIQKKSYKTVLILAPSHYFSLNGISVWKDGIFQTPLGDVPVDSVFAAQLIERSEQARFIPDVFTREHSLEVQIPFLQKVLKTDFKIVPVIMGQISYQDSQRLARIIKDIIGQRRDVLIVASSDLSHYNPYEQANKIDDRTLSYLCDFDIKGLCDLNLPLNQQPCGIRAITLAFLTARELGFDKVRLLKHANSGDATGDKTKGVVGYASLIVYGKRKEGERNMLSSKQRERLLKIARESLELYINKGKRLDIEVDDPQLRRVQGAFVTLTKDGQLRGCIGRIIADKPLCEVVRDMAIEAAVGDPRFDRVAREELSEIEIEISVLSPLEKISDVNRIEVGKHGIILRRGFRSGLLLPQVATQYGWDRETFLTQTCYKAGLPVDAWKDSSTEIYIFSAEVFSEKSH